jgi:16S rRNA (guanine527-N7)-methyltransferase
VIDLNTYIEAFKKIDLDLTKSQLVQFKQYYEILIEWNKKINLTAITDELEVYHKHFLDSVYLSKIVSLADQTLLDVGSGAGFPSLPLKIIYPHLNITIIDALSKRIKFLEYLTNKIGIDVTLIHGRIEEYPNKESYDIVTARAVANLNMLSELCIPFVKKEGFFITPKGSNYQQEIDDSMVALKELGVKQKEVYIYDILGVEHALIKFEKVKETPKKYPRKFKKIKSKPL